MPMPYRSHLAQLYVIQGRYADAEPLYRRSLAIRERAFGPDHPKLAQWMDSLLDGMAQAFVELEAQEETRSLNSLANFVERAECPLRMRRRGRNGK